MGKYPRISLLRLPLLLSLRLLLPLPFWLSSRRDLLLLLTLHVLLSATRKQTSSRPKQRTASPSVAQWRDPCISPLLLPSHLLLPLPLLLGRPRLVAQGFGLGSPWHLEPQRKRAGSPMLQLWVSPGVCSLSGSALCPSSNRQL